jgi:hypothetical protein
LAPQAIKNKANSKQEKAANKGEIVEKYSGEIVRKA